MDEVNTRMPSDDRPLVAQADGTILLETRHPLFLEAKDAIGPFAETVKSHDELHTFRLTPLSLWNAAARGWTADGVLDTLSGFARYELSTAFSGDIRDTMGRYGLIRLDADADGLMLTCADESLLNRLLREAGLADGIRGGIFSGGCCRIPSPMRGRIKQELMRLGYPVLDRAGYVSGERCPIAWRTVTATGRPLQLRPYQIEAIRAFLDSGPVTGGSGVLVLPCGAGKTVIGIGILCALQSAALILTTHTTSVRQWIGELLDKTDIPPEQVGAYTGETKEIRPITVATYHILTHRRSNGTCPHMNLISGRDWGLIIYDEVHLLPAPVFRVTAELQATRRLGLTATLVREDGRERDVFSLVGPKLYELPWKELEDQGYIAAGVCQEIRISMDPLARERYASASAREKGRIAAENPRKLDVLRQLLTRHADDQVLIIGQYVSQLEQAARTLDAPLITGSVPERVRKELFRRFANGDIKRLVVSKVANLALNLPDASVAIQLSGTFGSRQEEAQRLGRILRPKTGDNRAVFYTLVTRDSCEQEWARNRQRFLLEQGYRYEVKDQDDV